jgi:hypothetical protein
VWGKEEGEGTRNKGGGKARGCAGGGRGAANALVGGLVKVHLGPLVGFGGLMTDN